MDKKYLNYCCKSPISIIGCIMKYRKGLIITCSIENHCQSEVMLIPGVLYWRVVR